MARNIKITRNEFDPETPEVLAASIIKIANALELLMATKELTDKAIVVLLKGMPGMAEVSGGSIALVIENIRKLKSYYVRKQPSK